MPESRLPPIRHWLIHTACCIQLVSVVGLPVLGDEQRDGIQFFEQHIRPLLIEHCYECHSADEDSGGLRLDSKTAWQAGGESGSAIVAGEPEQSRLIEAVRYTNLNLQMPPSGKLSRVQISALEQWVARGAPDPRDAPMIVDSPDASDSVPQPVKGMSIDEGRNFWSLQPLSSPAVPPVATPDWVANPVDAFVLARLEAAGLQPAPAADRRALLRRVTYDLIGLPPTPAEVEDFVNDTSPNAFQQVCERLLASPQYGERWGRHWLDVARYADSNGLDENLAFGNAWRYRDYVITAFNQDKPFDQFVMEQLAGDLLPVVTPETLTATGFLMLGAKVLAEPDREKLIMDTVDEQIDTTGKALMGMTLGCARCHDHKFDPILQQDYYALAGFFKSTRTFDGTAMGAIKHWHEHALATDDELAQLKEVDAQIAAKTKAANEFKSQAMSRLRTAAQENAARYMSAASQCAPGASLNEIQQVANRFDLHPRILYNLRVQLELRSDEPVLSQWHQLVADNTPLDQLEKHFTDLLELAKNPPAGEESDPAQVTLAQRLNELLPQLLVVPVQPEFALDEETLASYYDLMDAARIVESSAPDATSVMGVSDGQILVSVPVHIRGSHRNLGQPVPRAFPTVMQTSSIPVVLPRHQSGRLELAQWIASSQHPLTARVFVNRIWRWHFGRGLVPSTENFGVLGDRPSHPELLDWLARYFIETGWSTKDLHRLLLTSHTYQMATEQPDETQAAAIDPENELLWKFRRQRLEAEQLRDSILAVCGRLDETMGGKTVPLRNRQFVFNHTSQDYTRYDSLRRAVYLPIIRNNVYTLLEQFDFPDATMPVGNRQATVIATQALLMLNDELVMDAAQQLADHLCDGFSQPVERTDWAYRWALGRPADAHEVQRALQFVQHMLDKQPLPSQKPEAWAWGLFCHALLVSNEFMTVE